MCFLDRFRTAGSKSDQGSRQLSDDPAVPDDSWFSAGEARFSATVDSFYGSPESLAKGGFQRLEMGDLAAALAFFRKSIDLLHTLYVGTDWERRQPNPADEPIV